MKTGVLHKGVLWYNYLFITAWKLPCWKTSSKPFVAISPRVRLSGGDKKRGISEASLSLKHSCRDYQQAQLFSLPLSVKQEVSSGPLDQCLVLQLKLMYFGMCGTEKRWLYLHKKESAVSSCKWQQSLRCYDCCRPALHVPPCSSDCSPTFLQI